MSRDQRPGRRDTPARSAKQVTRRNQRQSTARVKAAAEGVKEVEKKLSKLGGDGPVEGAKYHGMTARILDALSSPVIVSTDYEAPERFNPMKQPILMEAILPKAEGDKGWTLGQARSMLRQGYRIDKVIKQTGWGPDWFDDLPLDEDGYGLSTEEWVASKSGSKKTGLSS